MAAWTVRDDPIDINSSPVLAENVPCLTPTHHFYNRPLLDVPRSTGDRVRSLAYNRNTGMLASLQASLCDASVFFWDPYTITELCAMELPYCAENVCMEVAPDYNLLAVGSRSHISFIDGRMANRAIGSIRSWNKDCGIRSLQFKQELISVGTGAGNIVFYDLRAARFLSMIDESELTDIRRENVCCRYASNGWLRRDATYRDYFSGSPPPPSALYTHKYSPSLSRLLLAGGPLPLGLYGNYCAVWS